jgi:hypothetical protein
MADKKEYIQFKYSGDNDIMNSAHIHCKLFWRATLVRVASKPKGNENAIKTGGMTFRITSTQYGWKIGVSITQLNPLKFKTWKLQEKTLSRVTSNII